jgi:SAM-dependent MidA family methyltransferase
MSQLPTPDAAAQQHSQQLQQSIIENIHQHEKINFADYMQMALYQPQLGYYSGGCQKFGRQGDFVTAPEISPLFSRCLAHQAAQVLNELGGGDILEFGAGSGKMACDILLELNHTNDLPDHYYIIEVSAELQQRQQQLIQQKIPELAEKVSWLSQLPETGFQGIVLANEVLDAMPVHIFRGGKFFQEAYINYQEGKFAWHYDTPSPHLTESLQQLELTFDDNYQSEINVNIAPWINSLANFLSKGLVLLIDYGFPRHEYYHPQRDTGTLACHYQQQVHFDPLILPGLQDITAHVDFTAVASAALNAGFALAGYTTQAYFLLNCGLLNDSITKLVAEQNNQKQQYSINQQIKMLTLPSEMGELFKAIALTKGIATETLIGFTENDQRTRL